MESIAVKLKGNGSVIRATTLHGSMQFPAILQSSQKKIEECSLKMETKCQFAYQSENPITHISTGRFGMHNIKRIFKLKKSLKSSLLPSRRHNWWGKKVSVCMFLRFSFTSNFELGTVNSFAFNFNEYVNRINKKGFLTEL